MGSISPEVTPGATGEDRRAPAEGKSTSQVDQLGAPASQQNRGTGIKTALRPSATGDANRLALVKAIRDDKASRPSRINPAEIAQTQKNYIQQSLRRKMATFFARTEMPAEKQDAVINVLADINFSTGDILALARERGLSFGEAGALTRQSMEEAKRQLAAIAGPQAAQDIMDRWYSFPIQSTLVADVQTQCTAAGFPLTSDQADALALMLYHAQIGTPSSIPVSADLYKAITADDETTLTKAGTILNQTQISFLRTVLAHRRPIGGTP